MTKLNNKYFSFNSTEIRLNLIKPFLNDIIVSNEEIIAIYNFNSKNKVITNKIKGVTAIETYKGEVFVGTGSSGLFILDNGLRINQKIIVNDKVSFLKYNNGYLYFITNNSFFVYKKKGIKYDFINRISLREITFNGEIKNILFEFNNVYLISNEGVFTLKNSILNSIPHGRIKIFDIKANDVSILNNQNRTIKRKNNDLTFQTSINTFNNPDCFKVYYKLERNNEIVKWKPLNQNKISFKNLTYGDYVFEVYCVALSNSNLKSFDKFHFSIETYFWETIWFKVFTIILLILLFFIFFLVYKRSVEHENNLKLQLINLELKALKSQMNPHFLFNALNNLQSIMFLNDEVRANSYFVKFSKLLRNTLEITSKNITTLDEELKYINSYIDFEQIRSRNSIKTIFNIEDNLNLKNIEVPVMILQPIVENAIIHGLSPSMKTEKVLKFEIRKNNHCIEIVIEDNGVGRNIIQSRDKPKSFASSIIMERFSILNKLTKYKYKFDIFDLKENGINLGTKVVLLIPIKEN